MTVSINQKSLFWIRKYYFQLSRSKVSELTKLSVYLIHKAESASDANPRTISILEKFYFQLYQKVRKLQPTYNSWGDLSYDE